ncbi:MAG: flagellar hook-basal body complex protein, partial [candidate division Zixibacteria bacterium]|nr:flagellar hook-basal body complex protein [candidate division Zixibacteria bacterium]
MMASLFAGVSGLKNHQTRMNVTGDNIANINTIGYKLGRSTFQEALVQTLRGAARPTSTTGGTNPLQMGLGMSLATIDNQFSQGGLESTGQVTDIAIQGSGFFMLSDGDATYYTRAGAFGFDANANMIQNSTGYILQGKMAETNGEILASTPLGNISIPFGQMDPPNPTTEIVMSSNLNSSATDADATLTSAGTTNISSVSGTAINGVGGTHNIIISGSNATNSVGSGTHANQINDVTGTAAAAVLGAGNYGQPIPADYDYVVTAVNALGETLGAEVTLTVPATADSVDVTWNAVAGATSYKIYRRANGEEYNEGSNGLIGTWTAGPLSFSDTGLAGTPASPPSANMTVNLVGTETLGSNLDVTGTDGLRMRVDNGDWISLAEITTASTINDLISVINSKANGITA